ncbi:MAG: hypothetical protein H0W04_01845 [Chthoniobacterales bacterium]|nr:hypothetical protein [Chthoniobacterales bacterium]
MKLSSYSFLAAAVLLVVSCQKPQNEADRNAQIEQEVQQRLAAERQADEQQRLARQQAELEAREKAIAEKEAAAQRTTTTTITATATPRSDSRVASGEQSETRSYDTFYRKLDPYGAWRETSDYGFVWQPREAQRRDWRPYTDGRWAYTEAGWTWVSDEPFGWATYHYGRWTRLSGVGWVWVPGEEWAPAWVSWRKSDQHVGWAPLPPEARFERRTGIRKWADSYYDIDAGEYVFIPNEDIGNENLQRAVIPQERNVTIVTQTINVTNITYNNTTIVNEGPDFNELRVRSRQPLERKRIERQYNVEENETPRAVVRGETIAMMTPLFSARAVQRPQTVGEPIRQVTVERGTSNQPEAERARAKMRSEATPPPDAPPKRFQKPEVADAPSTPATPRPMQTPAQVPAGTPKPALAPTAAPSPRVVASAPPISTPTKPPLTSPTPPLSPRALATASPRLTPTVAPVVSPTATPSPRALATPTATSSPTISPVATPTPTPSPRVVPTATLKPTAAPVVSATVTPSLPPRLDPTLSPASTAKPLITPAATPFNAVSPSLEEQRKLQDRVREERDETRKREKGAAAPVTPAPPSATPSPVVPLASTPGDASSDGARTSDAGRDRAAAAKAEQWRQQQAIRTERLRDMSRSAAKNTPTPPISPGQRAPAAVPHESPAPAATDPSETTARAARRLPAPATTPVVPTTPPSAIVTPPPTQTTTAPTPTPPAGKPAITPAVHDPATLSPSPTPSPTVGKGKRKLQPGQDKDIAEPQDSPAGTDEP